MVLACSNGHLFSAWIHICVVILGSAVVSPLSNSRVQRSLQAFLPQLDGVIPPMLDLCAMYRVFKYETADLENCICVDSHLTCTADRFCADEMLLDEADAQKGSEIAGREGISTHCVESIGLNITFADEGPIGSVLLTGCATYAQAGHEKTCAQVTTNLFEMDNPRLTSCKYATYGGEFCSCEVCDKGLGLDLDCTKHNIDATTSGCKEISNDGLKSFLAGFGSGTEDSAMVKSFPSIADTFDADADGGDGSNDPGNNNVSNSSLDEDGDNIGIGETTTPNDITTSASTNDSYERSAGKKNVKKMNLFIVLYPLIFAAVVTL